MIKTILFLFAILFVFDCSSQKTLNAEARDSLKYIQWGDRPLIDLDKQPDVWIISNWGFPIEFDRASSTLDSQGGKKYGIENLADDDPRTAWIEGKTEYGLTEFLEIKLDDVHFGTHTLAIYNGYQSSIENFKNNSRVKTLGLYVDGEILYRFNLLDVMGKQVINYPTEISEKTGEGSHVLRFIILDVYPGEKRKDTAISEMYFQGG